MDKIFLVAFVATFSTLSLQSSSSSGQQKIIGHFYETYITADGTVCVHPCVANRAIKDEDDTRLEPDPENDGNPTPVAFLSQDTLIAMHQALKIANPNTPGYRLELLVLNKWLNFFSESVARAKNRIPKLALVLDASKNPRKTEFLARLQTEDLRLEQEQQQAQKLQEHLDALLNPVNTRSEPITQSQQTLANAIQRRVG